MTSRMRREPRQERSRRMVERIVAAGREVLVQRGYDAVTTNHIAAAAGISPGSLYQYFPDKSAVLAEVLDRYSQDVVARVSRAFLASVGAPTADGVRAVVTAMLDVYEEQPDLLRVLVEQVPRSAASTRAAFARRVDDMLTVAIGSRPDRDPGRPAVAVAWLLVRAVEHVTISYVLERPPIDRDTVIDELTALVATHLDR
ncbi:TetR/AcrR family transcriptional regulator [Pseudonocardia sp.]|uniref:TetR/AcrR family transcriptional regulator n=1 Tax=Pseudonocardia sp. TaxID=60912 RepID=UPI003D10F85E